MSSVSPPKSATGKMSPGDESVQPISSPICEIGNSSPARSTGGRSAQSSPYIGCSRLGLVSQQSPWASEKGLCEALGANREQSPEVDQGAESSLPRQTPVSPMDARSTSGEDFGRSTQIRNCGDFECIYRYGKNSSNLFLEPMETEDRHSGAMANTKSGQDFFFFFTSRNPACSAKPWQGPWASPRSPETGLTNKEISIYF
ncbi:hypothetical protein BDZ91DRAFT_256071 [Kalaharituber pfeilii]|nr:hypothetical protein BDZ91DRAFT_256071 [Kalaharituber pfeilii]